MTIAIACYLMCDRCGNAAEISTEGSKEARKLAKDAGFEVVKGVDLCPTCLGKSWDRAGDPINREET